MGFTLTQLGPPNKVLKLEGPNLPYGRPRHGAVFEQEREIDTGTTRYAGNRVPARHIFTDEQKPIVLTGRFMDSRNPTLPVSGRPGTALGCWDELDLFVADAVPVRAEWDSTLAITGICSKCKRGVESETEFVWTLTIEPDKDDTKPIQAPVAPPTNVSDQTQAILDKFYEVDTRLVNLPPDIEYQPSFLDQIRNAISSINSVSASFKSFANSVDNYESALSSDVAHFRAGIAQYGSAIDQLQLTLSSAVNDPAIVAARGPSQTSWFQARAQVDADLLEILAVLAVMDLTAEIQQQGQPDTTYVTDQGDTWESIAAAKMGSAGKADALRQANGARGGTQPTPGQVVNIPKTS